MKEVYEREIVNWFEWCEKSQSGYLGYPKHINFEPTGRTNEKRDNTPNTGVPDELVFIDFVMMTMPAVFRKCLKHKFTAKKQEDLEGSKIFMSKSKYYETLNMAFAFVDGSYNTQYPPRRKSVRLEKGMV